MKQTLNLAEVQELLRQRLDGKSQKQFAAELGISAAYLCDMLQGKREPGAAVLNYLGLKRSVMYERSTNRSGRKQRGNRSAVA